jgi:hypothetical protein
MQMVKSPRISLLRGEKMEGVRSRTVGDKYWQIRAKAREITINHGPLHSRTRFITI